MKKILRLCTSSCLSLKDTTRFPFLLLPSCLSFLLFYLSLLSTLFLPSLCLPFLSHCRPFSSSFPFAYPTFPVITPFPISLNPPSPSPSFSPSPSPSPPLPYLPQPPLLEPEGAEGPQSVNHCVEWAITVALHLPLHFPFSPSPPPSISHPSTSPFLYPLSSLLKPISPPPLSSISIHAPLPNSPISSPLLPQQPLPAL